MKKSAISTAVALVLGSAAGISSISAQAALTDGKVLTWAPGEVFCTYGGTDPTNCRPMITDMSGSFFTMDADGNGSVSSSEKTALVTNDGIIIGSSQAASGSHAGAPDGTENPGLDEPWFFFSNTGMTQTVSPVTVVSDDGAGVIELDFSGWSVTWNGIPNIDMGGGFQDCGTTSDGICVNNAGDDLDGTFDNGTGIATLTCSTVSCSTSATFTLSYAAVVPQADPSNFGGVPYTVTLAGGHVGAPVPVPAAAWLFGSGLMGLVGVARRRKARA